MEKAAKMPQKFLKPPKTLGKLQENPKKGEKFENYKKLK